MYVKAFFVAMACCILSVKGYGQAITFRGIDSARQLAIVNTNNDSLFIQNCFYIAEAFMEMNMYDSGQVWLNHIAARVPLRKPSFFNFYLSTDQSETYYYNGLMMMHLQESQRMLRIARALNDSLLLASANNFLGLAYMNVDSVAKSILYFKDGIRYARQPPYPPQYLSVSKPHHLYGNLAEAFYKLCRYDSALHNAYKARDFALQIPWPRGIAVTSNLLGLIYASTGKTDSAIQFQKTAIAIGLANGQEDVSLIGYSALAACFEKVHQKDSVLKVLNKGFNLLQEKPYINHFFAGQFLGDAIELYKKMGEDKLLLAAMEHKIKINTHLAKQTDAQITTLVNGSVANETRAATLELAEANSKQALSNTRLLIALLALASMVLLFILNRRYHKKQLKEIEIRNKISQDLHDDIGATLSSIQIYGELAGQVLENKPAQSKEMMTKITGQTKELMSRMGDVIWSMKPATGDKNSVAAKLKSFGSELLTPKEIRCNFIIDEKTDSMLTNPLIRKNILLIAKEAMNNIAKYSQAAEASVTLRQQDRTIVLEIKDNGKGFSATEAKPGNGLQNIRERCRQMGGACTIDATPGKGVNISCSIPIASISHNT